MRECDFGRLKLKLLGSVVLAGLVSACASDVSRFSDDPFKSPFQSRTAFDPVSTASVNRNAVPAVSKLKSAPISSSITQPLPAASQPILRTASIGSSSLGASATTGAVAAANYPNLAPSTPMIPSAPSISSVQNVPSVSRNPVVSSSANGWTAVGGTPVTLGQGENVNSISSRYGVPASAILAVNGLPNANAVQPGQQLMIPAYNPVSAGGAKAPARLAQAAPVATATAAIPRSPVRDVAPRPESDAEKRAAAKLKSLNNKPVAAEDDEDEDEKPAKLTPKANIPKKADASQKVEPTRKLEDGKKLEAHSKQEALKKAEAAKKIEEAKKIEDAKKLEAKKLADAKKAAETKRLASLKTQSLKKNTDDDVETTASIPESKPIAPKAAAAAPKAVEPVAEAEASNASSFRWPAQGRVISGFGAKNSSGTNDGINIALPEGTPVRAAEGGTVVHADDALKGYGKLVLVRHPNGFVSVYAHNGELNVKRGESVKKGQVIAKSGQSGNVTSPQLHFEIRKGATPVDPNKHLASN